MKNIHLIATTKEPVKGDLLLRHLWKGTHLECISWWRYNDTAMYGNAIVYTTLNGSFMDSPSSFKTQHIYITDDSEIKEGDWLFANQGVNKIIEVKEGDYPYGSINNKGDKIFNSKHWKSKIILTTDQDLIADGVQAIDDEFLEWFVKNPSCEEIDVKDITTIPALQLGSPNGHLMYKIIIPQEEPKQECTCGVCDNCEEKETTQILKEAKENALKQETLKEAAYQARRDYQDEVGKDGMNECIMFDAMKIENGFKLGAKWQAERMYNEEEIIQLIIKFNQEIREVEDVREWFEQFKKK